jgi:hypothetical protein
MANIFKNAFYDPTTTSAQSVYVTPADSRAIVQNIQVTNKSGSKNIDVYVIDASAATTYQVAFAAISGPTTCNLAKGPIVLQESDVLLAQTSDTTNVSAIISIMEMNRNDENG